ncbi:MAG: ABC transporter substrate-binding protein [Chloroflexota bacterium]|nr:ABC transporter substrate-binding protein [Chloroflexota bacterium]
MRFSAQIRAAVLLLGIFLTACSAATPTAPPATVSTEPASPTPQPTLPLPATPQPHRLILCTREPSASNPFAPSQAGDDLLALFYEPAAERVNYQWEARLLARIPSFANGDALTQTAQVQPGDRYTDASGALLNNESDTPLTLPQLSVTFTLSRELRWSDGEPLTAKDALLGYHLAQEPAARDPWRELAERTARFEAVDEYTLRWVGVPGYLSPEYPGFCFPPQPAHLWQNQELTGILAERTPPGTGPFMVTSWTSGKGARLLPNPHYSGPQPRLEEVIVRFPQFPLSAWPALLSSGDCDIILPAPARDITREQWSEQLAAGEILLWANPGPDPTFLRLDFNVAPEGEQRSPLAEGLVRRALAHCINRGELAAAQPDLALLPAESFLPPSHPAFASSDLRYIPDLGQDMLSAAGWRDEDGDGIREAHDVDGFPAGTPLSLTLTLAPQYIVPAAHIAADLEACGVGILPNPTAAEELYRADPSSPLFGRTFELALYGWWADVPQVCGAWRSDRIPTAENAWLGENFSGYASEEYDAACQRALVAVEAEEQYVALREAQQQLARELPTLFLTWRPFWFAARAEVQGLRPDESNRPAIWNIEEVE